MAKFCGKCGAKLDESTGLCPNCDADKLNKKTELPEADEEPKPKQGTASEPTKSLSKKEAKKQRKADKKAAKKAKKKEKWTSMTLGQKVRRVFFKLLLGTILFIILACGIVGTLVCFQIVDFPIIDRFVSESKIMNYAESVEREISETNISDFTLHQSSETNIVTNVEQGVTFVNNEVLVTIDSSKNKQKLENYISQIGGTIVGEIPELADYQILLDKEYDIHELQAIITELSKQEWVVSADPNYCIKIDTQYIPNDKKWSKKWDDVPDGTNWGVEAIDIQEAWDYQSNMTTTVNVGVIDNMFDVNHEDLVFSEAPLGNVLAINNSTWSDHGTHTSGTIAATTNNKVGIAGISINDNLYGVSYVGLAVGGYDTLQSMKIALYYLIATNNCAVINMSIGVDHLTFEASRGGVLATNELNNLASGIENLLQQLIDRDYQFVICKSAGNQNEVGGGYQYFRKDENVDDYPYEYYSYSDYLKYLSGESGYEYFAEYKDKRTAIERRLESGNVDAKYDFLGTISNQEVKNRIIVVGAAESLGTHKEGGFLWFGRKTVHNGYSIASFSQCGNRVDVLAPGVDIYSCVKNGYSSMPGTSMAAPHVSGVASLLFSVNPNLSADDVKSIICDTTVGSYGNESYGLLNAKNAVEAALNYIPSSDQAGETGGTFDLTDIPSNAVEFNGHYYYVYDVDTITDWNMAQEYCDAQGGYLATITSAEEDAFLYSYITGAGYSSVMFGLTDQAQANDWHWVTEKEFSYQNWRSGEPNHQGGYEHYGMYYERNTDGTWNDGSGRGGPFLCEWGEYQTSSNSHPQEPVRTTSDERDIVLVLDTSGSMSGTPMEETKKAAINFVNTILEEDASIGVVTYEDSAEQLSDFSVDKHHLTGIVTDIYDGGGTNIESGLAEAKSMLDSSNAKKKIIVLMSDGEPNRGREGEELIAYADEIKNDGVLIYTLGFFENMSGGKSSAQYLMEHLASDGCHYEVANADDLVFFFEDMADQINGQKYIYIRIACPVDVTVTHNGETLCSAEDDLNLRTDFGTLTFEENENVTDANEDDRIKVLRLKEGEDYDVQIVGTGHGIMDYTIGFMDENGDYSDFRRFEDIKITRRTMIDTVAAVSKESVLNIDEDGDGKYDLKLRAEENGFGEKVEESVLVYVVIGGSVLLLLLILTCAVQKNRKKKKAKENN